MIAKSGNKAVLAFTEGKAKKTPNTVSTGNQLFLFGNLIAEWRADGLYISNGGYHHYDKHGNDIAASATTKKRLNDLPNVRVTQAKCKLYQNGTEWDGSWIKVEGVTPPKINPAYIGDVFSTQERYVRTDGWRGYSEPIYAVAGANDTGTWSDSPCPSNVREAELNALAQYLSEHGVPTQQVVCQSSNVFCVHVYLIAKIKDVERARVLVQTYLDYHDTRLLYKVA